MWPRKPVIPIRRSTLSSAISRSRRASRRCHSFPTRTDDDRRLFMSSLHFTKDHEWIRVDGNVATVGITNYAQEQLGDVVFVELPAVGKTLNKGDEAAV